MQIDFVSSLTAEDEDALAPALLKAITGLFDLLPIAYSVQLTTSSTKAFSRTRLAPGGTFGDQLAEGAMPRIPV